MNEPHRKVVYIYYVVSWCYIFNNLEFYTFKLLDFFFHDFPESSERLFFSQIKFGLFGFIWNPKVFKEKQPI